jgi:hypothetical protein
LQVAPIIDTLKPESIIASTIRHSFSALPEYISPSSNTLAPQASLQPSYFCPPLRKASKGR